MIPKLHFKDFLLNENKQILGHKVADILNAVHDLNDNGANMGARLMVKRATTVVNMIRRILHSPWNDENKKYLKVLQKVGVAIMKAIDEKDDLPSVIAGVSDEIGKLSQKMHVPVNDLGSDEGGSDADDGVATSGPPKADPAQMPDQQGPPPEAEAGGQPGQMPPPGGQVGAPPQVPPPPGQQPGMPPGIM